MIGKPKTVLIGLDGATFSILDPLMARGVMPFLREFVAGGVRAPLRSVIPALTPPAWTSLMTGKRPGQHGVFDFFQKESADSKYFRLTLSNDVRSDTIWSLTSAQGGAITALNFPQMFPAPIVSGSVVPGGWMPWRQLRLGCQPSTLFDRLKAGVPSFNPRELSLDMAMEEKALEGCAAEEYAGWITLHANRERRWTDVLGFLMTEQPTDLTAILFDGVDKLQHLCWRFLDPALAGDSPATDWEREIRDLCEDYFRKLDALIAEIVGLAGPDATVILASDHGFGPSSDIFFVNTWLEQAGYLAWSKDGAAAAKDSNKVGIGHITRHVFELDWENTLAYAATPSSQGIHIVRQQPGGGPGVPPEDYLRVRDEIKDGLRRLRNPITGRPVVSEVLARDEVFPGPFEDSGPDLTMHLEENGVVSILRSEVAVKRRAEPVGTHHPVGILYARGPGLKVGVSIPEVSIVDVAPLILYSLDLAIPDDLSGRVPTDAFYQDEIDRRPPRTGETAAPSWFGPADASEVAFDEEEEAIVLGRLKALGYLE